MAGFWPFGGPSVYVKTKQGTGGRWRWEVVDGTGRVVAVAPVRGFETEQEARAAAKAVGGAKWTFDEGS